MRSAASRSISAQALTEHLLADGVKLERDAKTRGRITVHCQSIVIRAPA